MLGQDNKNHGHNVPETKLPKDQESLQVCPGQERGLDKGVETEPRDQPISRNEQVVSIQTYDCSDVTQKIR